MHRAGRTGRIGKRGTAVSLVRGMSTTRRKEIARLYGVDFIERQLPSQEAILTAVRELPAVLPRMRAHIAESDPWTGEAEPGFTSFLDPDGRSGYLYAEPLEAFAEHSEAVRASFLDPGTPLGRAVEVERLSGHAIVDALSTHVERLDVVALHSAPTYDGSVLAIHVLGGRDALTGELVGVVLERVWT